MGKFNPSAFASPGFAVSTGADSFYSPHLFATIGGVLRAYGKSDPVAVMLSDTLTITDNVNQTPNTATFTALGFVPTVGQPVVMALAGINNPDKIFRGTVLSVHPNHYAPALPQHHVVCIDPTWGLNRKKVTERYVGQTVTAIVADLITKYAPGYTVTHVAAGLPVIDEIAFEMQDLTDCLTALATRIDEHWKCDYDSALHLPSEEGLTAPTDLTLTHDSLRDVSVDYDLSQIVTRVLVEGQGATVMELGPVGGTYVAVDDISMFSASGGELLVEGQRLSYTAIGNGPMADALGAPTVALGRSVSTVGLSSLTRSVSTATGTTASAHGFSEGLIVRIAGATQPEYNGEFAISRIPSTTTFEYIVPGTPVSPATGSLTVQKAMGGQVVGPVTYKVSAIVETVIGSTTNRWETSLGTASGSVTGEALSEPTAPTLGTTNTAGPLVGAYSYRLSWTSLLGETLLSPPLAGTITPVVAPGAGVATQHATIDAGIGPGTYAYKLAYTGADRETSLGTQFSIGATQVSAPGAANATTSATVDGGLPAATWNYKLTFYSAKGETTPSSGFSAATTQVSTPGNPFGTVHTTIDGGLPPGNYSYATTFYTSRGETVMSSTSTPTITAVTAPGAASVAQSTTIDGGLPPGTYQYKIAFVTAAGETTLGTNASVTATQVSAPSALSATGTTGGNLTPSTTYNYRVTYYTANGETSESANDAVALTSGQNAVSLTSIPTSSDGRVVGRKIYRSTTTSTWGATFRLLTTIANNTTTTFTDTLADAGATVGIQPTNNSTGSQIGLTSIPTSGDGRVSKRRIYRTKAGGSVYFLLTTLDDNSTTTFTDTTPDTALIDPGPGTNTTGGRIDVTSIATSGDGRVVGRKLYRTKVGGTVYYLLTTIADNTTTSFVDTTPDTSLNQVAPTVNTTGGQVALSSLGTSGDGRVIGRKIYRTKVGGADYFLLHTISDNTTATFTDTTQDASLTQAAPTTNTTGSRLDLTTLPVSAESRVTGRRIYRTKAGGTVFYLLGELNDNTTTAFVDLVHDNDLAETAPDQADPELYIGASVNLTGLATTTDPRVVGRKLYRTTGGGTSFRLVSGLDTTSTTFLDHVSDGDLGEYHPGTNSTLGDAVSVTAIPLGPAGTIARRIWRTQGSGSQYFVVGTLDNNTATTFTDAQADGALGEEAPLRYYIAGIPASGTRSIRFAIRHGARVNLLVTVNDTAAQTALATLLGSGDGIQEAYVSAPQASLADATERGEALLALHASVEVGISYTVRDQSNRTKAGSVVTVNLPSPTNVADTFKIQSVTITSFQPAMWPLYTVSASKTRFTFTDLLRFQQKD